MFVDKAEKSGVLATAPVHLEWLGRALLIGASCFYAGMTLGGSWAGGGADLLTAVGTKSPAPVNEEEGIGGLLTEDPAGIDPAGFEILPASAEVDSDSEQSMFEPDTYSSARPVMYTSYRLEAGDVVGKLSALFGLNQDTIISVNGVRNSRTIRHGEIFRIPNQDGILYTAAATDTIDTIAEKFKVSSADLMTVNEYFAPEVRSGEKLFVPGARLDRIALQEINGDLFIWPTLNRYITSAYGWRRSPITGTRLFHNGIDIRGATGTAIYAAMAGRVTFAGWDNVYGYQVVITHHSGYRTMYGHLSHIRIRQGAYVTTGQRIGDVGNTGASTGPHLHFTVYKNGVSINPRVITN